MKSDYLCGIRRSKVLSSFRNQIKPLKHFKLIKLFKHYYQIALNAEPASSFDK